MFQNAWSAKSGSSKRLNGGAVFPANFITKDKIEFVRSIYWDEHCLECSAPACYSTCPLYLKRPDGACRRFDYGIKVLRRLPDTLWRVRLKYRKWAKIEARINGGSLSVDGLLRRDSNDRLKTRLFKLASLGLGYDICRKWDGLRRKGYAQIAASDRFVNDFLFQCFSYEKSPFELLFEIADRENKVMYKTGLHIAPGYNQELLKLEFPIPEGGLVRLYPENNLNVELEIYAADFIALKNNIPAKPAGKIKCVAWDLDNTVWLGILAESNPEDLSLRDNVLDTIREFDRRGVIQIVVSKNDKEAVEPVLKKLGIYQYFVYIYANWNPKSENVYYAARMLNIGIDTFALIDDSQYERTEVQESLPCVRAYDEKAITSILDTPEFNLSVTEDGSKRRLSYQQEASRKKIRDSFSGQNSDFIKNCRIELTIGEITSPEHRKRSLELLLRTNQLNLSAHRYGESEFDQLLDERDSYSLILWVKDRFGDYGQVGFMHFKVADEVVITEYAMSCRVASKLVENALFDWLRRKYGKTIVAYGVRTERNGTLVDAFSKVGFKPVSDNQAEIKLQLDYEYKIPDAMCVTISS